MVTKKFDCYVSATVRTNVVICYYACVRTHVRTRTVLQYCMFDLFWRMYIITLLWTMRRTYLSPLSEQLAVGAK